MRLLIGISGATGAIYGIRLLEILRETPDVETHLVITDMGKVTIAMETGLALKSVEKLATHTHNVRDLAAPIASGSFQSEGMIVAPCSARTLSAVANSANDNLLTRSADVTLKERRRLLLLFRETPLHAGHCRLMLDATQMGAIVMPPVPGFYTLPKTIDDIVNETVSRVLDFWKIETPGTKRWGS